jgi:RNA polymerase sigma factor (sigma-70 family)
MNSEGDSDVAVPQRKKEFDEAAPRYLNLLFAIIFSITHDRELAHEVGQQAIYKYFCFMEKNKWEAEVENEQAYLVTIAKNLLKDRWDAEDKSDETSIDEQVDDRLLKHLDELIDDTFDVEKHIYFEELLQQLPLKTIFGNLTDYQKTLVQLYFYEDMTFEEIALILKEDKDGVNYRLKATLTTICKRVKKICGKKGLFKSDK